MTLGQSRVKPLACFSATVHTISRTPALIRISHAAAAVTAVPPADCYGTTYRTGLAQRVARNTRIRELSTTGPPRQSPATAMSGKPAEPSARVNCSAVRKNRTLV